MATESAESARRLWRAASARRRALEVSIGDVAIGGLRPIAVQSMTTTKTSDAAATAAQVVSLARAGCDIVRVTVPGRADADALPEIRRRLRAEGVRAPLVADIHFTPHLALKVVEHVEKVRVNPGNFADKKRLTGEEYDERRWQEDQARVYELFAPLVDRARELGVALRIGVNHGSLADRLVHRFGDTPEGMVQSALEFLRICEDRGHRGAVVSMKASNPQVMVRAYRLLVERLDDVGLPAYPLHLGVTEAGSGDEGRMKSAAGIGTLLADGLGDTVRVSLTEDPLAEVPVGREIVRLFAVTAPERRADSSTLEVVERRDPLDPLRRETARIVTGTAAFGGEEVPRVELTVVPPVAGRDVAALLGARPSVDIVDVLASTADDVEAALAALRQIPPAGPARAMTFLPAARTALDDPRVRRDVRAAADRVALVCRPGRDDASALVDRFGEAPLLLLLDVDGPLAPDGGREIVDFASRVAGRSPHLMVGLAPGPRFDVIAGHRLLAAALDNAGARAPLVLVDRPAPGEDPRLGTTGRLASLLVDGLGDAVRASAGENPAAAAGLLHGILQSARRRLERAEYIACPACGRTLFGLEETTEKIRQLTSHLKLKIAVMGCIVNGPGEMADADFGYVGWGEGKVALFAGREMVAKDIAFADAPGRLVELIKARGHWADPPASDMSDPGQ